MPASASAQISDADLVNLIHGADAIRQWVLEDIAKFTPK